VIGQEDDIVPSGQLIHGLLQMVTPLNDAAANDGTEKVTSELIFLHLASCLHREGIVRHTSSRRMMIALVDSNRLNK